MQWQPFRFSDLGWIAEHIHTNSSQCSTLIGLDDVRSSSAKDGRYLKLLSKQYAEQMLINSVLVIPFEVLPKTGRKGGR